MGVSQATCASTKFGISRRIPPVLVLALALLGFHNSPLAAQDKFKVHVEVRGVNAELERNVLAVMELARTADTGKITHQRIARMHQRAEADITTALRPYGFYRPVVVKTLEFDGSEWSALYDIDPGPAIRVKSVSIELTGPGAELPEFQKPLAAFPLHEGDTLRDPLYEAGKLSFLAAASDSGYLDANFDSSVVRVDRDANTADILIRFHTGPRYKFGAVRFEQDILDETFLRKRLLFQPGDPYRQDRLLELQTVLAEDPYFIRVEVLPQRKEAHNLEVPIRVVLEPRGRWSEEVGLGYGTDTGPRGRSNSTWRRINRRGHYAEAQVLISPVEQTVQTKYHIPAVLTRTGVLTFTAGFGRLNPQFSDARALTFGTELFQHRLGWQETISLKYQRTRFEIGADSAKSSLVILSGSYERIRTDSRTYPTRGLKTQIDVQGSQKALLSSASFLQIRGNAKVVYGFVPRFRLLVRADLGYTFTKQIHELPPMLRFFAGGDLGVRGFGYQSLGPRDALGNVIGGQALMVGSAEVDYRVLPTWTVAVFSDAGNAMQRFSPSLLEYSVGAGIRYISPIGMIRLDGALAVSRSNLPFRLHISMGPDL